MGTVENFYIPLGFMALCKISKQRDGRVNNNLLLYQNLAHFKTIFSLIIFSLGSHMHSIGITV